MHDTALLVVGAAIVALSAVAGLGGWFTSLRSIREHRAATEEALRAKEETAEALSQEVARLDEHIVALRELDSIRFAHRYIEAKTGLESRVVELSGKLDATRERKETLRRELERMLADDETRGAESVRLRSELHRAQQEANRLEQILESLSEVGPIPADHVKAALTRRRQAQIELRGRLDRLNLAGVAREAALDMLRSELENARNEERELERDLEIAHSAAPVLDGLLGITADVADRLEELQGRLGYPLRVLAESRQDDRFLRAIGAPQPQPAPHHTGGAQGDGAPAAEPPAPVQAPVEAAAPVPDQPLAPSANGLRA